MKLQSQPKVAKGEPPLYTGAFDATRKAGASDSLLLDEKTQIVNFVMQHKAIFEYQIGRVENVWTTL